MQKNKRLKLSDREYIERALKKKVPVKEIAAFLDVSYQTIYYEIEKGSVEQLDARTYKLNKVYLSDYAQKRTRDNKRKSGVKTKMQINDPLLQETLILIRDKKYSPKAALVKTGCKSVCAKTLYNWIHSGRLKDLTVVQLPYAKKHRKKKRQAAKRMQKTKGKLIETRPEEASSREVYGHWEMDTVYSNKEDLSCLLVLSERMTRTEIVIQTPDRTERSILKGLNWLERKIGAKKFREHFKTITCDNGVEFSNWEAMEKSKINRKQKRTAIYYCHAYSSWERGTNENENRMIRRWIPKGDNIGLYSKSEIKEIQDWINNYPREILGGLSSNSYKEFLGIENILNWL